MDDGRPADCKSADFGRPRFDSWVWHMSTYDICLFSVIALSACFNILNFAMIVLLYRRS